MIFIKLTLQDGREIWVNPARITDISKQIEKDGSMICSGGESGFNVTESPEEIISKIQENSLELELIEGVEVSGYDLPDKMEGYIKHFKIEYNFSDYGFNGFKLKANDGTGNGIIRTCYPEINDCINASFRFMDNYLKTGNFK